MIALGLASVGLPFGRAKGNVYLNKFLRFAEPRGPQPPPSGGPLFAFAHSRGRSAGRGPNIDVLFVKQALRLRAVRRRPTAADCNSPKGSRSPPPSANSKPADPEITKKYIE